MKIVYSLAEYLRLVVSFDFKTQPGVQSSEALFQALGNALFQGQLFSRNGNERIGFETVLRGGFGFP